jgi:exopolyphosphatase/guanosine-5'-triphosphate,3'-diphosphate pyrophosphatase
MAVRSKHNPKRHFEKKGSPQKPQQTDTFAAIDLGTNNCRLLVAQPVKIGGRSSKTLKVLDSFSRIVRLGEGVAESALLSEEAIERTLAALKQCKIKLDRFPECRGRYVATEACRRAENSDLFLQRVREEIGIEIEIISTEEEANLAFMGCASLLNPTPRNAMTFDIGGGSTEFMWVDVETAPAGHDSPLLPHRVRDWFSMPHGVMNLLERFGGSGYAEIYFEEMVDFLARQLQEFDERNAIKQAIAAEQVQLLSTSGTVTTLAAIYLSLPRYERAKIDGITLGTEKLSQAITGILEMRASKRFNHPCIGSDRSDYIISGCAIFEAIRRIWPISDITIADRGVREGILMSLMSQSGS